MNVMKAPRTRFALLCFVTLSFSAVLTAQTYTITDLGTLPGFGATYADDNNNAGPVTACRT